MKHTVPRNRRAGFSLLELMIGMTVLTISIGAIASTLVATGDLNATTEEVESALSAATSRLEVLRSQTFDDVFANNNADPVGRPERSREWRGRDVPSPRHEPVGGSAGRGRGDLPRRRHRAAGGRRGPRPRHATRPQRGTTSSTRSTTRTTTSSSRSASGSGGEAAAASWSTRWSACSRTSEVKMPMRSKTETRHAPVRRRERQGARRGGFSLVEILIAVTLLALVMGAIVSTGNSMNHALRDGGRHRRRRGPRPARDGPRGRDPGAVDRESVTLGRRSPSARAGSSSRPARASRAAPRPGATPSASSSSRATPTPNDGARQRRQRDRRRLQGRLDPGLRPGERARGRPVLAASRSCSRARPWTVPTTTATG